MYVLAAYSWDGSGYYPSRMFLISYKLDEGSTAMEYIDKWPGLKLIAVDKSSNQA